MRVTCGLLPLSLLDVRIVLRRLATIEHSVIADHANVTMPDPVRAGVRSRVPVGCSRTAAPGCESQHLARTGDALEQLAIEQSADHVRILWPLAAANFVLDETNDLNASPIGWTQVPFPYQTNATDVAVTLPLAAGNKFYRLRKP